MSTAALATAPVVTRTTNRSIARSGVRTPDVVVPAAREDRTAPGGSRGGLVLTRRGRRLLRAAVLTAAASVLAAGLVLLWLAVAAVVAPGAVAGDGGEGVRSGAEVSEAVVTTSVVVGPGDTLWQIARTHAPERDPRSVVDQVVALNSLDSTGVQAGATLLVPTS
ncbi:LysM peptidoglycan-binding domain-containing protein [Jannaschia sp. R86511]|uniref:LysM peptidoglycan-binding domain-containing protein n=1 Tax=Jannaschia sp. R86511 TaxID=3093853 RepID=UPI0036D37631